MRLVPGGVIAGCVLGAAVAASAAPPAPGAQPDGEPGQSDAPARLSDLTMANPSSIAWQYARDRERGEGFFRIPGLYAVGDSWSDLRSRLDEQYGFRPTLSFAHIYQWASDKVGSEKHASGFELVFDGTWTPLGRDTDSATTAGFEVLWRDRVGTDIPPVALFTQAGTLYPTTVAFGDIGPSLGQLWLQQIFANKFGVRIGKLFPISSYDFFPLKNFRTDFVDGIHAANLVIPLPDRGLGTYAMFRPRSDVYVRVGVHDANADPERSGINSIDEWELFKIVEVGFDPGLAERQPGRPPPGDVHVSFWHQDERDDANVDDGWGFVLSGSQRFGRFLPFLRYGYSSSDADGPAIIEHLVNGGVAVDDLFGRRNDRIGLGVTWSRPAADVLGRSTSTIGFRSLRWSRSPRLCRWSSTRCETRTRTWSGSWESARGLRSRRYLAGHFGRSLQRCLATFRREATCGVRCRT